MSQMSLFDRRTRMALAARLDLEQGIGLPEAIVAIESALQYGPASAHWDLVLPYLVNRLNEIFATVRGAVSAIDEAIACEAQEGVRDHEQGLRMVAHHPDLAELDAHLDDLYD